MKTAEWLGERHAVRIHCYKLEYALDGEAEYISCTRVFPPFDLVDQAIRVKKISEASDSPDFFSRVNSIKSPETKAFFESSPIGAERLKEGFAFRINGSRRFFVGIRRNHAYVWQYGRFEGDGSFWRDSLGPHSKVTPVDDAECLSFILKTKGDFEFFLSSVNGALRDKSFGESEDSQFNDQFEPSGLLDDEIDSYGQSGI